jgi:hypothetical protein
MNTQFVLFQLQLLEYSSLSSFIFNRLSNFGLKYLQFCCAKISDILPVVAEITF